MQLSAQTRIEHETIRAVMERLRFEHRDHEVATGLADRWRFETHYGALTADLGARDTTIRVEAEDETRLCYMKMAVAHHIAESFGGTSGLVWSGDGIDAGTPPFFRELQVVSSTRLGPHMRRLRLAGRDLARFAHGGFHVRILLPPPGRAPCWPVVGGDGLIVWPSGEDALTVRVYTIRAIDAAAGWLDIDFVLHPGLDTPAARFAETAMPGDSIGMIGPGGAEIPEEAKNLLILGDDAALPAIGRILDELAPGIRARVLVEVDGAADRLPLADRDNVDLIWLHRDGRAPGTAGLLAAAMRDLDPAALGPDLYLWAGCEFSDFRAIRGIARKEWKMTKDRHLVVAYWRRGAAGGDGSDD